jgi:MOSC domain-containing protein YiiM
VFSKAGTDAVTLRAGVGVDGDCHSGVTVQHLSRVRRDASQPNLRQVHLIPAELLAELADAGFDVAPGQLGENISTRGIDLLGLPRGTRLHLGPRAVIEVTGLRNPCAQIDRFRAGLLARLLYRDDSRQVVRRAGVMAVVLVGGDVGRGDGIRVELPSGPLLPLSVV